MTKNSIENPIAPVVSVHGFEDELTATLRDEARKMLQSAIEVGIAEYIAAQFPYKLPMSSTTFIILTSPNPCCF